MALKVFVVGAPRSGTSITYVALRRVFRLAGRGESHLIPAFTTMLSEFVKFQKLRANPNTLLAQLHSGDLELLLANFIRDFYAKNYPRGSWVDKTPGAANIRSIGFMKFVFPDAKFIATKRSGIEVVSSATRKFAMPIDKATRIWVDSMAALLEVLSEFPDILVVDQFDMTNAPDRTAEQIATFLGRPQSSQQLANFLEDTRVGQKSDHDWQRRLTLADVAWSPQDKKLFLRLAGDMMEKFGYALE